MLINLSYVIYFKLIFVLNFVSFLRAALYQNNFPFILMTHKQAYLPFLNTKSPNFLTSSKIILLVQIFVFLEFRSNYICFEQLTSPHLNTSIEITFNHLANIKLLRKSCFMHIGCRFWEHRNNCYFPDCTVFISCCILFNAFVIFFLLPNKYFSSHKFKVYQM